VAEAGGPGRETSLIVAEWPEPPESFIDADAEAEIGWLIDLVTEVRSIRSEMNVPPGAKPAVTLSGAAPQTRERLDRHRALITTLARLGEVTEADAAPAGAVPFVIGEATGALAIAEHIDVAAERARLLKEVAAHQTDAERTRKKLDNATSSLAPPRPWSRRTASGWLKPRPPRPSCRRR
jgi:valyl-tRNA synthetase